MDIMFAEHELHNSCRLLFGTKMQLSRGFLEYLQLSGIKSAYRQKALETHPDRYTSDIGGADCADLFMNVHQAYENLCSYVNARAAGYSLSADQVISKCSKSQTRKQTSSPRQSRTFSQKQNRNRAPWQTKTNKQKRNVVQTSNIYTGPIPERRLLFGHYLYYSGIANWQTITKALVWQRTKRPRLGELGCRFGWLSSKDILCILKNRSHRNTFGKSAMDLGLLNKTQLKLLILQQKRLQKKFGEYFIANNLLSTVQLTQLVKQFRSHNYAISGTQAAYRTM